ncbi:hypothetical protein ACROYT_G043933 [Oculina patagonica]
MDNGLVNGVVFIDLKKAFDTVDHGIMLVKLKNIGVTSTHLAWFDSYLSSRCQKTVIGQASSSTRKVSVGVPQGSILGPLLFTIYINDLPTVLRNSTVTLFADDTALHCSSESALSLQTMLNEDLVILAQWLHEHKLTLNVSKSKFMLIGGPKKLTYFSEVALSINDRRLDRVNSFKYLGVIINENLTWTDHIENLRSKVLQRLGLLRRIKCSLPRDIRELFVKSTIIPLLDYADVTWGDKANLTLMKKVQVLQNLAAKIVLDMPRHSSATEALQQLGWDNLMERRRLHRLILFFKALNGLIDWDFNFYSVKDIHNYNTRGRNDIYKDIVSDHALEGHVFKRATVDRATQCHMLCKDDCRCISMNVIHNNDQDNCELNNINKEMEPAALKYRPGASYYDLVREYIVGHGRSFVHGQDRCVNRCCRPDPCFNGGTCGEICDPTTARFNCTCPAEYTGQGCEKIKHPRSCKDLSFSLGNVNLLDTKRFGVDFPANEDDGAINWKIYRLSLSRMQSIAGVSTHLRATCNFPDDGLVYTDYARAQLEGHDLFGVWTDECRMYELVNIRGIECRDCTAGTWQKVDRMWHINSRGSASIGCEFDGREGSVNTEQNFGRYQYTNHAFRCTSNPNSTTQHWFGSKLSN